MDSFPLALMYVVLLVLSVELLLAAIVFGCDFLTWVANKIQRLFS